MPGSQWVQLLRDHEWFAFTRSFLSLTYIFCIVLIYSMKITVYISGCSQSHRSAVYQLSVFQCQFTPKNDREWVGEWRSPWSTTYDCCVTWFFITSWHCQIYKVNILLHDVISFTVLCYLIFIYCLRFHFHRYDSFLAHQYLFNWALWNLVITTTK